MSSAEDESNTRQAYHGLSCQTSSKFVPGVLELVEEISSKRERYEGTGIVR
jgi:hypothetical protein